MAKKFYLVLDTETISDARIVFDIAGTIIDRKGHVCEQFNYFVSEVVDAEIFPMLLKGDSFTKNKADFYLDECYEKSNIQIYSLGYIQSKIHQLIKKYNNATVVAYNAAFDCSVLNNCFHNLYFDDQFFDDDVKVYDLMNMALATICNTNNYINFAKEHDYTTEKGNIQTNAEVVYRYLTNDIDFNEAHTALADTEIEAAILTQVFRTHKKLNTEMAGPLFRNDNWKKVQARAKK